MSHLVTQAVPVAHSLGWPPARLAPGPHARGRGSSSGCGDWTASALDSPPCSPCGRPASSSTAGGAGCAGPGGTLARSSDTCVVFAWSSAGILQPPMMRTSTPDRDVGRRRAEEDEEALTGSFSKKTPPKKTAVSDRWNHYTFKPVLAMRAAKGVEVVGSVRPALMLLALAINECYVITCSICGAIEINVMTLPSIQPRPCTDSSCRGQHAPDERVALAMSLYDARAGRS